MRTRICDPGRARPEQIPSSRILPIVLDIDHCWLERASDLVIGWHGPGKLEAANQQLGENFENPGIEQENVSRYLRCTDKDRRSQLNNI